MRVRPQFGPKGAGPPADFVCLNKDCIGETGDRLNGRPKIQLTIGTTIRGRNDGSRSDLAREGRDSVPQAAGAGRTEQGMMMFCRVCGNPLVDGDKYCQACGAPLTRVVDVVPQMAVRAIPATAREVGGWLSFVCILLTIVQPVAYLWYIAGILEKAGGRELSSETFLLLAVFGGLTVWSFSAGFMLWKGERRGLEIAEGFYFTVVWGPAALFGWWAYSSPSEAGMAIKLGVVVILLNLPWWLYLQHSKRVKATFLDQPSASIDG